MKARRWILLLTACSMGGFGCAEEKARSAPTPAGSATSVAAGVVDARDVPIDLRAVGSAEARRSVAVRARVDGQLLRVAFTEGQDVRQGDLLFQIDSRPYAAALAEAEAALARDLAQARSARAEAVRNQELVAKDYVTRQEADNLTAHAAMAEAAVRADSAAVEAARLDFEYCTVRAPIGGRTGSVSLHEGNLVRASDPEPIVRINQIAPIEVSFTVPEESLAEIRRAQTAGSLSVQATVPSGSGESFDGALTFIDNNVDAASGTVRLKATFANETQALWPGQFVNVTLRLGVESGALTVPTTAVQDGQSGPFVFKIVADRKVALTSIEPGRRVDGRTVVRGALSPGDSVVTDGQLRLTNGARVRVKAPAAP